MQCTRVHKYMRLDLIVQVVFEIFDLELSATRDRRILRAA